MYKIMNDIIKDLMSEDYTMRDVVLYGIVAPAALVLVCVLLSVL